MSSQRTIGLILLFAARTPPPLTRPAALKCAPAAICTKNGMGDTDCPPQFFCDTEKDGSRWCTRRTDCSDCGVDDQCPAGYFCAVDAKGGRYCGKACAGGAESTD